jgi:lipoprotein-anchoring transpeptidase ErfK/SrfK
MKKFFFSIFLACILFISPSVVSAQITTTDKLITVDTGAQILRAWEGGKVVMETPVSTGLPLSPTVKGSFKIYVKIPVQKNMRGYSPYKGNYNYANVPHVMYFYQGYGFHGAYWHTNWGRRMSNGCVNMPLDKAEWLFNFAPVGTRVEIY